MMDSELSQNDGQNILDSKNKNNISEKQNRLLLACLKLDPEEEQAMAEEGMAEDFKEWPEY